MAFSFTVNDNGVPEIAGRKRVLTGTFTNTGNSTGGDIKTGFKRTDFFVIQRTNSSTAVSTQSVTETFPLAGGDVTIAIDADVDGIWRAEGV